MAKERITYQKLRGYRFAKHGQFVWDDDVTGFHVRLYKSSKKRSFGVRARLHKHSDLVRFHNFQDIPFSTTDWPEGFVDEARERARELIAAIEGGWDPSEDGEPQITLNDIWAARRKLDSQKTDGLLREKTVKDTEDCLRIYSSDWLNKPLADITTKMVLKRATLIKNGEYVSPITGNKIGTRWTVRSWLTYASAVFEATKAHHGLKDNPFKEVLPSFKRPPTSKELEYEDDPENFEAGLTPEQVQDLLNVKLKNERRIWQLCCQLQLLTAMRANEVTRMRWSNVNGEAIKLERDQTKSGRAHTVPITPRVREILDELEVHRVNDIIFPGRDPNNHIHTSGMPAKKVARALGHTHMAYSERANKGKGGETERTDWTSHDLRRTWSACAEDLEIPEAIIGRMLNHSAKTITSKAYARVSQSKVVAAAEKVHDALLAMK